MDFFGGIESQANDYTLHNARRKELVNLIKKEHSSISQGVVVLFAAFENESDRFRQDKTFYYYTGINEPGAVLIIDLEGKSIVYLPNCLEQRSKWMALPPELINKDAKAYELDALKNLGSECAGYQLHPYFTRDEYSHVIDEIEKITSNNGTIFTTIPNNGYEYTTTRLIIQRLHSFVPVLEKSIADISPLIARMRRIKDMREIENLYQAVSITELAHEAAAQAIKEDVQESEVQAALEYIMIASQSRPSFPSIVASGKNATVLHYTENNGTIKNGDLVVVDIGAEVDGYCADLTRTYPASGTFTERQKELYTIVLETQEYIANFTKPGMWLKNKDKPEESLHHLAQKFLADRGYDKYFPHGIGHFLGLDVHDVGDYSLPLQEGDVITIEPGIYIPEEEIGIRIEDNYWVVKDGVVCLSENLPKLIHEIEAIVQKGFQEQEGQVAADFGEDEIHH